MKPPPSPKESSRAAAWEALEAYAAQAELERIDALTPEQVDAELLALGIDPRKGEVEPEPASGKRLIEPPPTKEPGRGRPRR